MQQHLFVAKILGNEGAQHLTISATSLAEAHALASSQGRVVSCKKIRQLLPSRALTSEEREQFLTQMSFLTGAGVGTGQALRILQENGTGRTRDVAAELLQAVEQGSSLAAALSLTTKPDFPSATRAMVWAGYRAGAGSEALEAASHFEAELRELKQASNSGLISAAVGFGGAAVATLASVFYMGPKILESTLVASAGDAVNVDWAMTLGLVLGTLMLLMIAGASVLGWVHYVVRKVAPRWADSVTLAVPLWNSIALGQERFLSLYAVSSLLAQHIELEKAFETAVEGMVPGMYRQELVAASEAVKHGMPWVSEFALMSPLDKAALRGAANREQLAQIFGKIAHLTKSRYARARQSLAIALQAVAALCLVTAGGLLFALSTLPLLQSASAVF